VSFSTTDIHTIVTANWTTVYATICPTQHLPIRPAYYATDKPTITNPKYTTIELSFLFPNRETIDTA
jgi:hypothetical protein